MKRVVKLVRYIYREKATKVVEPLLLLCLEVGQWLITNNPTKSICKEMSWLVMIKLFY